MPVDLSSLLADTLSARGYEVEDASPVEGASGASYPVSLVARQHDDRYLVDVLASRTVRDEDVQAIASIVDDAGLAGAIVVALAGAENSEEAPGADRVDVWGREEFDRAVGTYVIDRHIAEGIDPDEIGPSPVEPYDVANHQQEADADVDAEAEPMSAPQADGDHEPADQRSDPSTGEPSPADAPQADPDPTPADPSQDASPEPTTQPNDPDREAPPHPEPEPAAASTSDEDEDAGFDEDPGHRDLVDPEDMLERAERLMEKGAVDDGDAELLVEEDEPTQEEPTSTPEARAADDTAREASKAQPDPASHEGGSSQTPNDGTEREGPAEDGSDAEILEPEPTSNQEQGRPQPEGEPPEPETAATARDRDAQPEPTSPSREQRPSATASPAAAAGPADEDPAFVSGTTIEPQIGRAEARRKAEEALFEADEARLELLPFRVYRYRARLVGDGHDQEEEGRVWVSTQSGAVVRAPTGDRVEELDGPHERFEGSLSGAETQQAARGHLLDTLERRDERRQDYSESAVIERVRLEPDPDTLDVDRLGRAYAPRWRVDGRNGTVFVDAVTGELVNE